jgi:hypothetical protein
MNSGGVTASESGEGTLEPAEIHDVLRNDRRRMVLERLWSNGGTEAVRDLAEEIAAAESGERPPPQNVRQSVYISLHQTHLPKLDELDIAEYDADDKQVHLDERASELAPHAGVARESDPDRSLAPVYLGVGVLGVLATAGRAFGVPLLIGLPDAIPAALLFGLVALLAAHQLRLESDLFEQWLPR